MYDFLYLLYDLNFRSYSKWLRCSSVHRLRRLIWTRHKGLSLPTKWWAPYMGYHLPSGEHPIWDITYQVVSTLYGISPTKWWAPYMGHAPGDVKAPYSSRPSVNTASDGSITAIKTFVTIYIYIYIYIYIMELFLLVYLQNQSWWGLLVICFWPVRIPPAWRWAG